MVSDMRPKPVEYRAVSVSVSLPLSHLQALDAYAERKEVGRSAAVAQLIERAGLLKEPSK